MIDPAMPIRDDLEQRLADYESLLEIGVEVAGSLDLDRVLELALDRVEKLCRAETSSVWGLDAERGELFFRVVRGAAASDIEHLRVPLGEGIVGSVAENQSLSTVTVLAEAVEKRDPYTGGHVRRVVYYSLLLGHEMGLDDEDLERLRITATLHDVGKIAVPDEVLRKPAPLDEEEIRIMRRHPEDGAAILSAVANLEHVLPGVRHHHERLDGRGYPDGLVDEQIPLAARIIAVADTYDAMTTSRPYRSALEASVAEEEIRRGAGTQFCPQVVAAFGRLVERRGFDVDAGRTLFASLFGDGSQV